MAFTINNNLVFIDRMQSMCSILNASVKNWSEMDFKYLSQEIGDLPEFTNKTGCINMNTWAVLKGFLIKNYLIAVIFLVL